LDRGWHRCAPKPAAISPNPQYLAGRFYYACLTNSEAALRLVLDTVGADRVVLGIDWPTDMRIDWPVARVLGLQSLTQEEKELILWKNLERLLGP
jgi:aminocarboxymuconate-semialdehyde decarboxylase